MISLHTKRFNLMVGVAANLSLVSVLMLRTQAQKVHIASYTPPANTLSDCGDALADALQQDSVQRPCWANIRPVDHANPINLAEGGAIGGNRTFGARRVSRPGIHVRASCHGRNKLRDRLPHRFPIIRAWWRLPSGGHPTSVSRLFFLVINLQVTTSKVCLAALVSKVI